VPYCGGILQDYGCKRRVVAGEGEFNGINCLSDYQRLEAVFSAGGSGLLSLPNVEPFMATLISLELIGKAQPNCVAYRFVFWEDQNIKTNQTQSTQHHSYTCAQGENLWKIAAENGTTVANLIQLNPQIKWPNQLNEGEQVVLP
jgi:hypothetical protein